MGWVCAKSFAPARGSAAWVRDNKSSGLREWFDATGRMTMRIMREAVETHSPIGACQPFGHYPDAMPPNNDSKTPVVDPK